MKIAAEEQIENMTQQLILTEKAGISSYFPVLPLLLISNDAFGSASVYLSWSELQSTHTHCSNSEALTDSASMHFKSMPCHATDTFIQPTPAG